MGGLKNGIRYRDWQRKKKDSEAITQKEGSVQWKLQSKRRQETNKKIEIEKSGIK